MLFIVAGLGIILGSFVNALVWRLKEKKNWVSERSVCSHCGHTLSVFDLVPVLSYIALRGKCRYCNKSIEDSPYVELGLGLVFALSYAFWPYGFDSLGTARFIIWLVALVLMGAMFLYDLNWTLLPDKLTRSLLALAFVQFLILIIFDSFELKNILSVAISIIVGGGIFHLIYELSDGKYIGGGDVKLGYAYGLLLLDPLMSWMVLVVASVAGSIISGVMIIANKKSLHSKIPFGPLLITGIIVAMLFGQRLWVGLNALML